MSTTYRRTPFDDQSDPRESQPSQQHTASEFMCRVDGCPNRWSVHREGWRQMCSAHAWSDPHLWPQITAEQREWHDKHRLYGEVREAARRGTNPLPTHRKPAAPPNPPPSTSRAYRDLHGIDDIEPDREA